MQRRRFLASVTATVPVALAGCMGGQDDEPSETTDGTTAQTTEQPTTGTTTEPEESGPLAVGETATLSGDRELGVVDASATAFVVTRGTGRERIHASDGERYVTLKFAPSGIDDYESFVAENVTLAVNESTDSADGATFSDPVFPIGGGPSRFDAAYSIPTDLTPYTATVTLDTGDDTVEWEFDARNIESVTQDVDYTVGSLSAPDSVAAGDDFTVELPVENSGDEVEFHAVLENTANAPTHADEDLPAGEETTVEFEATAPDADGDRFEVTVYWGHGEASATVDYE